MRLFRRAKSYFVVATVLTVGFLSSIFITFNTFAASNIFKITNAELTELSSTAEGSIWGFNESSISSDITFHKLNDTAKFEITFKNSDTKEHEIKTISDDNENAYITFSYDKHTNEKINANESFTLSIVAKYANSISDINEKNQLSNLKFKIYVDNEEEPEEVPIVPDTGDNKNKNGSKNGGTIAPNTAGSTGISTDGANKDVLITISIVSFGIIIFAIIYVKNHKKSTKVITILVAVLSVTTVATAVSAITADTNEISLATRFVIDDRYLVTWYDGDGNEHTSVVMYGETMNAPEVHKDGYNLVGWEDEDGNPFDISEGLTGNVKISPVFEPIEYTVTIDTDGDGDADIEETITYEDEVNLPTNNNEKPGHHPNGWVDNNGNHYNDGDDISGLITEDGGTVSIIPDFEPNHYTVNLDTDGDGNADTSLEVVYGEEVNLPENHAGQTGHHPNGWTDGNGNHYDDGEDISGLLLDDDGEITLTPDFAPNVFTVGLDYDGDGEDDQTLTVTYGEEALLPEYAGADMGSKKNGWIDELGNVYEEGEDISDLLLENGDSMSLKPNYVPIEYTIAIDTDDDGEFDITKVVSYSENYTLPTNTSTNNPGYNPNGWSHGRRHFENGESVSELTTIDGSVVDLYPDYTPRTISICYTTISDPTTTGEGKCETATFNRMYYFSENYFTRTGYDPIDTWSYTADGEKAYETSEEYSPNTDILACTDDSNCKKTLYAMWEPHQTVITYTPGEGVTDATGTVTNSTFTYDQTAVFSSESYTRPGYWHSGWVVNEDIYALGGVIDKWKEDVSTKTIPARWTPKYYGVMFIRNCPTNVYGTGEMETINKVTYNDGSTLTPNTFSCGEGYSFAGWKRDNTGSLIADGGAADKFDVDLNGRVVQLYAQWHVDDHFIAGMRQAGNTKMTANDGKDYYKMQDMTSSICNFVPTATTNDNNEEIQLVDTRDGKTYWVSKLKDGKCWMTQNLDLDLSTSKALTPSDSDVTASWTPNNNTYASNQVGSWRVKIDSADSYDPGDWYYQEGANVVEHNYTTNGANANFNTTPFASNGMHGHIGNYYNFQAFSAINDSTNMKSTGTTNTSICPKGWTLPSDYLGLLSVYGAISVDGSTVTTINEKALMAKPLYFVRSGAVIGSENSDPGYVSYPGITLRYPTNKYYYLSMGMMSMWQEYVIQVHNPAQLSNPSNTISQSQYGRGAGITVRCVAR